MALIDLLLAVLANTAWVFNFIAGKVGTAQFQPLLFTSLRFWVLLLLLLPWIRPRADQWKPLIKIGFMLGVLHFSFMFLGLHAGGDVSSVAIAAQLYVPFSALMAALFLGESIGAARVLGIVLAFTGVLIIGFDPIVFQHLDALGYVILASLALATATIMMKRVPQLGVLRLQAWVALVAAPCLLLLSLLFESDQWALMSNAEIWDFWSPVYSAVAASIVGHGIVYYLLGKYPVSLTAPLMLLAPVLAVAFGVLFWNDVLTWKLIAGGAMTLMGILVINVPPRIWRRMLKKRQPPLVP